MSEHTYCDRCGMEITGERHCMGEGGTGPIFPWFHPKFDLCGGCFRDWESWLPRSVSTLDEKCDDGQKEAALVKATEWVVQAAREVDQGATPSEKPYYDLVHAYAMESLHAALAEFNPEVRP
jgi:hypothetical protein